MKKYCDFDEVILDTTKISKIYKIKKPDLHTMIIESFNHIKINKDY